MHVTIANMEKIRDFIKKHPAIDFFVIIFVMLLFTVLFKSHLYYVYIDRGREFLLPREILNGAVPYKDITLIYFPLAYYINALIYKLLGVSINSLLISQTVLCTVYVSVFYCLAKEFINRRTSLLLTVLIISSCICSTLDLFSWLFPYSYARTYGCFGLLLCVFFIVKLFKTDNVRYAYFAGLACGFSCSCKLEFFSSFLILLTGLFFYKRLRFREYLRVLSSFLVIPTILLSIMLIQGVSFQNITDSIIFAVKFSKTPVMTEFLTRAGVYPFNFGKIFSSAAHTLNFLGIVFLSLLVLKLKSGLLKNVLLVATLVYVCMNENYNYLYWVFLPFFILNYCVIKFESFWKSDKLFLFLLIAALLSSQREFFMLSLKFYGTYSFPLLALCLCAIIEKYELKAFCGISIKQLVSFVLVVLIALPTKTYIMRSNFSVPVKTNKGIFNVDEKVAYAFENTISYIENNIDKNSTILVLPEGNMVNFITDRKVDLHCFMMDRLYHDAYGEEEARNMIAKTKSDYIVLIDGIYYETFNRPYLYKPGSSSSADYIWENYETLTQYNDEYEVIIMKRKNDAAE